MDQAPAKSQAAWWFATGVVVTMTIALWIWPVVPASPEAELRQHAAACEDAPPLADRAQPAEPRDVGALPAAPPQPESAPAIAPRPTASAPRASTQPTAAVARAPSVPAPESVPDMDFTAPHGSPPGLRAFETSAALPLVVKARRPRSIAPTFLHLNSRPWSQVYLDGQLVGNTPLRWQRVLPGRYSVLLVNRQFRMSKRFELLLREGERVTRTEALEPE